MSIIPLSSHGKLPNAVINSGNVGNLKTNSRVRPDFADSAKFNNDPESIKKLEDEAMQAIKEGRFTDITDKLVPQKGNANFDRYEGKTVVENEGPRITVGSLYTEDGKPILDPSYGEIRANSGAPDHAFFYYNTDFLMNAATEYAKLDEDEVYRHRNIDDLNFVRDTLDFFTGGNYTSTAVHKSLSNQCLISASELHLRSRRRSGSYV